MQAWEFWHPVSDWSSLYTKHGNTGRLLMFAEGHHHFHSLLFNDLCKTLKVKPVCHTQFSLRLSFWSCYVHFMGLGLASVCVGFQEQTRQKW